MKHFFVLFFVFQFVYISSALAYLDPGSGSYIFQIVIGFVLAGIYALKHYWVKIRNWLSGKKNN